jgi:hypothetical protein
MRLRRETVVHKPETESPLLFYPMTYHCASLNL